MKISKFCKEHNLTEAQEEGNTVEINPIKAADLLPILQKTNAYGFEKFKSLITF